MSFLPVNCDSSGVCVILIGENSHIIMKGVNR